MDMLALYLHSFTQKNTNKSVNTAYQHQHDGTVSVT